MSQKFHLAKMLVAAFALHAAVLSAYAIDLGPFQLTGFAKAEVGKVNNKCADCQLYPAEGKERSWADTMVPGAAYGPATTHVTLFQPFLGFKHDLGQGLRFSALLSQRWRDGKEDIPGFWYEKNIGISHEAYGSLRYGAMTTRGWSLADYPYGTNLNVADAWGSSGAGYGLLQNAVRYISPKFDVLEGDLVLEISRDEGDKNFTVHRGRFTELYAQYVKGDWVLDFVAQRSRNGQPQSWSHGPFIGLTPFPADDAKLQDASQGITMLMGRYQYDNQLELSGGIRFNRWSGAPAIVTSTLNGVSMWNAMFNVNWGATVNGVTNPGYAARSTDLLMGGRYRMDEWTASLGLVHLGSASTENPSERGQSNAAWIRAAGLSYAIQPGFSVYSYVGMVEYKKLGLSPMSMPGNSAFTNVDSRVTRTGYWGGVGVVYVF